MNNKAKLIMVDDEAEILRALERSLRKEYQITTTVSANEALQILESESFDLIISDVRMMEMDGLDLLATCQEKYPDMGRIALTGYADMETCQNAVNQQIAQIIISKPWETFELKNLIHLVTQLQQLKIENRQLKLALP